jgi:hypothetical protein
VISVSPSNLTCQASPSDPDNFPFVLLGNKVDIDGGNSRVVIIRTFFLSLVSVLCHGLLIALPLPAHLRSLKRRQRPGVPRKATYLTLRHLPRKELMWKMLFNAL